MAHRCPKCSEVFPQWMIYKMHLELCKGSIRSTPVTKGTIKLYTKEQKAAIVARGERRLGVHNFYGGAV